MRLGLSMVVKNESNRLAAGLTDIYGLFDEIVAVDMGSSDDTTRMLRQKFGARVIHFAPRNDDPYVITDARNLSLDENSSDWILVLDADEQLSRASVEKIRESIDTRDSASFLVWRNSRRGLVFDDYKLALLRNRIGIKFEGLVHSNP